jgi:hypothetical protein
MYPKMMPDLSQEEIQAIITPTAQAMPRPTPEMQNMAAQDMMGADIMQQEQLNAEPAL